MAEEKNNTILICEDDEVSRIALSAILNKHGFKIIGEAETGLEAINMYDEKKPDIVLLDINMPKGGGITTLRFMRELNQEPYIVMLTGDDTKHSVSTAKLLGANDYILKKTANDPTFLNRLKNRIGSDFTEELEAVEIETSKDGQLESMDTNKEESKSPESKPEESIEEEETKKVRRMVKASRLDRKKGR